MELGGTGETEIYDDPSELYYDACHQLADQFKDKVVISGNYVKALLPGKYSVKSGDVRIELDG